MVILDTDHLTVIQRRSEPRYLILSTRLRHLPASDGRTTIIDVEAQMRGWLAVIGRSKRIQQEIAAYRHPYALLSFFEAFLFLNSMNQQPIVTCNFGDRGCGSARWI
jgi:hypothetical protein